MATPAEMKTHLEQLEDQKRELEDAIEKANKRYKISLWGIGIGIVLLPLYWSGIPVLLVAGAAALFYSARRSVSQDKLGALETEIHKLEISMA
ncbi:MAG: hypothetical protein AB8I58_21760 [Anaerolineales bacterium]|jgi:hypothetical protein